MSEPIDHDQHLIGMAAGDPDAFARWVAGIEPTLRLTLRSFAGEVDTESVMQETLLRVWQVAPRFRPDGRPHGLLRLSIRIARNLCIDQVRRKRTVREADQADIEELVPASPPDPLLQRAISLCMEQLPKKPAAALWARLHSDGAEPDQELSTRVGMRLNTFLQNVTRARRALSECLSKRGVEVPS